MTIWLDIKYCRLLSNKLNKFTVKKTNPFLANCKCPLCKDSKKSKVKARGYFITKKQKLYFYCHNCNVSKSFKNFLHDFDNTLYNEYLLEILQQNKIDNKDIQKNTNNDSLHSSCPFQGRLRVIDLDDNDKCIKYLKNRKIPYQFYDKLYYIDKFKKWVNEIIPNKFDSILQDEDRVVIPFYDKSHTVIGFQGRSISKFSDPAYKYITIMLQDKPKVFGLERLDYSKKVYVVEGPFDSMFLTNCIASGGSSLTSNLKDVNISKENSVIIYDNEPRNKNILRNIQSSIKNEYNVVIWPHNIKQKDINDLILDGYTSSEIQVIIDENTFKGLEAQLRFDQWKRS